MQIPLPLVILSHVLTFILSILGSILISQYLFKSEINTQEIRSIDLKLASQLFSKALSKQPQDSWKETSNRALEKYKQILESKTSKENIMLLSKQSVIGGVADITQEVMAEALKDVMGDVSGEAFQK